MSKTKLNFTRLSNAELSAKGRDLMAAGAYRDAIQIYKQLGKLEPDAGWNSALVGAYLARAKDLAAKKMYKEAALLWENMIALGEPATSQALYIGWLVQAGQTAKAVARFADLSPEAADSTDRGRLEALFAVLMLAGDQTVLAALPADAELKRQCAIAHNALQHYCQGAAADSVREQLQAISFRSAFKDFRSILTALLQLEQAGPTAATELLARMAADSPFAVLLEAIRPSLLDGPSQIEALEPLSHQQREFAASLLGLDKNQLKLLKQWLLSHKQRNAKTLHDFIAANIAVLDQESARQACLGLLTRYPPSRKTYGRLFGPIAPFEAERTAALHAEWDDDFYVAEGHWLRCVELLHEDKTDPDHQLKAALILRHITDPLLKEFEHRLPPPVLLKYLETSLQLDPTDKATYLNVIKLYGKTRNHKAYQHWVDKAVARFPDDVEVLLAAIQAAKDKGAFKKAATYATTLLQRDPINKQARKLLIDAHLAHARKSFKARKYHLVEKELDAADQLVREDDGRISINRGLLALHQGQQDQAALWLKQSVVLSDGILTATLRLRTEAAQLELAPEGLQAYLSGLDPKVIGRDQVMSFIKLVNHYLEDKLDLKSPLDALANPLRAAAKSLTTAQDLQALCDCLVKVPHYVLLADCADRALTRWPHKPLFVYYQIYGRARGDIYEVSDKDFERLNDAIEQAHKAKDVRTVSKIGAFLDQEMGLGPGPRPGGFPAIPAPLRDALNDIESLPPAQQAAAIRDVITKLTAVTGTQAPPEILEMLEMFDEVGFGDDLDGPPDPFGHGPFPLPSRFGPLPGSGAKRKKKKPKKKRRR